MSILREEPFAAIAPGITLDLRGYGERTVFIVVHPTRPFFEGLWRVSWRLHDGTVDVFEFRRNVVDKAFLLQPPYDLEWPDVMARYCGINVACGEFDGDLVFSDYLEAQRLAGVVDGEPRILDLLTPAAIAIEDRDGLAAAHHLARSINNAANRIIEYDKECRVDERNEARRVQRDEVIAAARRVVPKGQRARAAWKVLRTGLTA